jgi:hypothetical protein
MKHPTLALLLLLVACTPNKQKDTNSSIVNEDWEGFEDIFSSSSLGVITKLGLTFFANDSIHFRLESSFNSCTLNYQGIAINPGILFDADHYENVNRDTVFFENYLLQERDVYINISVEIDSPLVSIEFVDIGNSFECIPDISGILRNEMNYDR